MTATSVVHLALLSDAENVALVRHVLGGVVASVGLDEGLLADVKTAVSEACGNVVLHAYQGARGPLWVSVAAHSGGMAVAVRDRGGGIKPRRVDEERGVLGVGLSLIQALTERVELRGAQGEGTEVRMTFRAERPGEGHATERPGGGHATVVGAGEPSGQVPALLDDQPELPRGETVVAVSPGALAGPVLGSVIAMLASRASFSVEGVADAQLLTDTIAAHADHEIVGDYVTLAIDRCEQALDLRLGPLLDGGASRLVAASSIGGIRPLSVLASDLAPEPAGGCDYLRLRLTA